MNLNSEMELKDVVLERTAAATALEKAGLDYCCGGKQTVGEACAGAGLSSENLLAQLREAAKEAGPDAESWMTMPLADLTSHIVKKHHAYVREALPQIAEHLTKAVEKHAEGHPELARIQTLFTQVGHEMMQHMQKEEYILFPYIEQLEDAAARGTPLYPPFFGTVKNPVAMMVKEHDSAGELVNAIRQLSGGYAPPADGCTTYTLLYTELEGFDRDLKRHVHLENNVLFPRAIALEAQHLGTNA